MIDEKMSKISHRKFPYPVVLESSIELSVSSKGLDIDHLVKDDQSRRDHRTLIVYTTFSGVVCVVSFKRWQQTLHIADLERRTLWIRKRGKSVTWRKVERSPFTAPYNVIWKKRHFPFLYLFTRFFFRCLSRKKMIVIIQSSPSIH